MKQLTTFLLTIFALTTFAQDEDATPKDPKAREKINAARVAYITERLELTPEEAEKFWPLYREYTQKRQVLRQQFNDAKREGQPADKLLDLDYKIKQQELDLERDYSGRLRQTITPQKLMNLRKAEDDFRKLLLQQIQQRQLNQQRREQQRDRLQQRNQQRNN
jgi:hypothetical protein